jgi:hypothetical protein
LNTDEALFVIDVCRFTAQAWADNDLELAARFIEAAFVTIEQCGDFIDVDQDATR